MIVALLRQLWRRRRLVSLGAAIALTAQILIIFHVTLGVPPKFQSRQYDVGLASAAVLIDSQSSQAVDLGAGGKVQVDVGALSERAKLLANLLVTRPLRDDIATMSGVRPDRLITGLSSTTEPGPPPSEASDVTIRPEDPAANILDLQTSDTVPIITVNAQAQTERTAARLAASTVTTLRTYLESVADENGVPYVRQLVVRPLGRPMSALSRRGPDKGRAAFVFVLLLGLWCAAIVVVSGLMKAWRQAVADEDAELGARLAPPDGDDESPGGPPPLHVGEGADDEPGALPPAEPASRVA